MVIGAVVAHDAHGADAGEDAEELGHLALIAVLGHLIPENPVGLLEDFHLLCGDLADDAHAQTGTGEGLPPDQLVGNAQLLAYPADLILEEAAQGLDNVQELHIVGHFDLVVVGFDLIGIALAGLDAVGVDGTLGKEGIVAALAADLVPEHLIELGADDFPSAADMPSLSASSIRLRLPSPWILPAPPPYGKCGPERALRPSNATRKWKS